MDLKELFNLYNIEINEEKIKQFEAYKNLLLEYNQKFNQTNITEDEKINIKHF